MKRSLIGLLLLGLAACGKDAPSFGQDWSKRPLAPVTETLESTIGSTTRTATFSIDLPAKMKKEASGGHLEWRADLDDNFSEPSVSVGFSMMPASVEEALRVTMPDKNDVIVKSVEIDGGFIVVSHTKTKGIVRVEAWKRQGERDALTCRASQAKTGGVPSPDATLAWLETICTSLTVK